MIKIKFDSPKGTKGELICLVVTSLAGAALWIWLLGTFMICVQDARRFKADCSRSDFNGGTASDTGACIYVPGNCTLVEDRNGFGKRTGETLEFTGLTVSESKSVDFPTDPWYSPGQVKGACVAVIWGQKLPVIIENGKSFSTMDDPGRVSPGFFISVLVLIGVCLLGLANLTFHSWKTSQIQAKPIGTSSG